MKKLLVIILAIFLASTILTQASKAMQPEKPALSGSYSLNYTNTEKSSKTDAVSSLTAFINSKLDLACAGMALGSATVTAIGGTAPYTYSWNTTPVQNTATATYLASGSYTVTVTDATSATATADVTIYEPDPIVVTITKTHIPCTGELTGSATAKAVGGTPPYTYAWLTTPIQTTATISNLAAGSYTVSVFDASGCFKAGLVTILEPATKFTASITNQVDIVTTGSSIGSVTITGSGGVAPYEYNMDGEAFQADGTFGNLGGGTYTIIARDANKCEVVVPVTILDSAQLPVATFNPPDGSINIPITTDISITFNAPVRNIDNTEITDENIFSLVSLSAKFWFDSIIPYTATIDAFKKVITLHLYNNLFNIQTYNVTLQPVKDANDNATSFQKIEFTTAPSSTYAYIFIAQQLEYTENFDRMGATGTTYLNGWTAARYGGLEATDDTLAMAITDGNPISGNAYNVGETGSDDRAIGSSASDATVPRFGATFLNSTGYSIVSVNLSGIMEQWSSGTNNSVNETTSFEYSLDATNLSSGTWVAATGFDLKEIAIASQSAYALNGNLPENQTEISTSITGINWTPDSKLWIRWTDVNNSGSDGLYAIDNLVMDVTIGYVITYSEPTNYPADFSATPAGTSIATKWTDATGDQFPAGYLVKISTSPGIAPPDDRIFSADDPDLSDGNGAKNIVFGQQNYTFNGLTKGTVYYFAIFPYTNNGTMVDYKTSGSAPSINSTTQNIILKTGFDIDLTQWTPYSTLGDQIWSWVPDLTRRLNASGCAKINGFDGSNFTNEDWLISPAIDMMNSTNTKLQFFSAFDDQGNPLKVLVSDDYTSGDPSVNGTWNDVSASAVFSPGGWIWTPSGFINLGLSNTPNVHIAFKYNSDAVAARSCKIDNIVIAGDFNVGISESGKSEHNTCIYPNPGHGWFNAEMPSEGKYIITITNAVGYTMKVINSTFDKIMKVETNGLSNGLYFVTIQNVVTKQKETHKLIVR